MKMANSVGDGMMARNKIIVAVDFEDQSIKALKQSYHLAKLFDAELLLLYVVEDASFSKIFLSQEDYNNKILPKAKEQLTEFEKMIKSSSPTDSNITINSLIVRGKPYEQIIQTAIDHEAILIVMGKNSTLNKKGRKFIGSNTFNVIRDAPCPVISLKGDNYGEFSNILLPLDFTKPVKNQIQKAVILGGYFGSKINIVSVLPSENKMNKLFKQVQLTQVKNGIEKNGLYCTTEVVESKDEPVYKTIIKHARKIDANLIIIMTQQKKNNVPFFIGSTAQEVIYESEIPVLSIIPSAKFRPGVVTSFVDPMGLMERQPKQI